MPPIFCICTNWLRKSCRVSTPFCIFSCCFCTSSAVSSDCTRATIGSWWISAIRTTCCCITSRSGRRRHARRSRCPTGWRSFITTLLRRSTSWACIERSLASVFADAASCRRTPAAATWRSATRNSIGRISRRLDFHAPACCPSSPISPTSIANPTGWSRGTSTTTGRTSCSWDGSSPTRRSKT